MRLGGPESARVVLLGKVASLLVLTGVHRTFGGHSVDVYIGDGIYTSHSAKNC